MSNKELLERMKEDAQKLIDEAKQAEHRRLEQLRALNSTSDYSKWGYISPQPLTRTPQTTAGIYQQMQQTTKAQQKTQLQEYFDRNKQHEDPMVELMDALFTFNEKWEFLKSIGYLVNGSEYMNPTTQESIVYKMLKNPDDQAELITIKKAFLKEMIIKFKNLLLSRASLKMKL